MTDLSGKIEGVSTQRIAEYLGIPVEVVHVAIQEGAKTFADVYEFNKRAHFVVDTGMEVATDDGWKKVQKTKRKPLKGNSPFGKRYF